MKTNRLISLLLVLVMITALCGCGKSPEVKRAEELIDAIGEVSLESKDAIADAEAAVDALSVKERESVSGLDVLQQARESYNALADAAEVSRVEALIRDIGTVGPDSRAAIDEAAKAYQSLDEALKDRVGNAGQIAVAEAAYAEALRLQEELADFHRLFSAFTAHDGWAEVDALTDYFDAGNVPSSVIEELLSMAEAGDSYAQYLAGYCYSNGSGMEQNLDLAYYWAVQSNEQRNSYGINLLANLYEYGKGVARNADVAFVLFEKAAAAGNSVAQTNLGLAYENGWGVEADPYKAMQWYIKAADQGHTYASLYVSENYLLGIGCEADPSAAFRYCAAAAEAEYAPAQYLLGYLYENGLGTPADHVKAVELWQLAARQGNADAILALSNLGETW